MTLHHPSMRIAMPHVMVQSSCIFSSWASLLYRSPRETPAPYLRIKECFEAVRWHPTEDTAHCRPSSASWHARNATFRLANATGTCTVRLMVASLGHKRIRHPTGLLAENPPDWRLFDADGKKFQATYPPKWWFINGDLWVVECKKSPNKQIYDYDQPLICDRKSRPRTSTQTLQLPKPAHQRAMLRRFAKISNKLERCNFYLFKTLGFWSFGGSNLHCSFCRGAMFNKQVFHDAVLCHFAEVYTPEN